jgi:protein containing cell adhesion domain protein
MAVAMAVSLVGCGVDITSVGLPTDIVLEKGETQQLNIEYGTDDKAEQEKIAEAASKLNLTWTSSDETVATVDETGLVTAVGAGEADVTVSVSDANISSTTHVKVVITPTGVEAPDSIELVTNGENSKALGAKMTPEDATEVKLAYESSDENVATVDENGVVTAVADGECVITTYVTADIPATAENAEAKPVVDEVASSEAEVADSAADSEAPDDAAASEPKDTTDSSFGVVPDGLSAETKVTVTTKVEQITLNKTEGVLTVGNSVTVTATVTPDNATNTTINWTSSDEKVATVDSNGKVTAVAAGNATIKATSESDGDVSADYALTVNKAAAKPATRYSGTTSSAGAATTPSYTAPSVPSASTPTYVPAPAPAPAPAPDPAPAPAPAEPSQPSGGSSPDYSGSSGFDANLGSWSEGSGIDWTQGATRS